MKPLTSLSGVYRIRNILNGMAYIGSAICFNDRWQSHRNLLGKGVSHSIHLQRAWNKYGPDSFRFEIILICERRDLLHYEQKMIDLNKSADGVSGYNSSPTAGSRLGMKASIETRQKISLAGKGRKMSAIVRAKISVAKKGKPRPRWIIEKMVAASAAVNRGKPRFISEATRRKISIMKAGVSLNISPERRAQLVKQMTGNKYSIGRVHTDKEKANRAAGLRRAYAEGRRKSTLGNEKLNSWDIPVIRNLRAHGMKLRVIAGLYGIDRRHAGDIVSGRRWSKIA